MKKCMAIMLAVLLLFCLAGCSKTSNHGHTDGMIGKVSTRVISDTLTIDFKGKDEETGELIFTIQNPLDVQCAYGYAYIIEVLLDGQWFTTDYGPVDAPAGVYVIEPGETQEHLYKLFNDPPAGTYRLILLDVYEESQKTSIAEEFTME